MFEQFIGTKPVEERHRIDAARSRNSSAFEISEIEQFKGGQSNPTYRLTAADGRSYVLRRKPPGQAAALGARGRSRIPRDHGAAPTGFPVARPLRAVRGRGGHRHRVLRHGLRRRPRAVGPGAAGHDDAERARDLRRAEPRDRRAARVDYAPSGSPTSASPATTSSARSRAGASSTRPPRPSRSRRWTA